MSMLGILPSTTRTASGVLDTVLTHLRPYRPYAFDAAIACTAVWVLLRWLRTSSQRLRTTQLRGPTSENFIFGVGKRTMSAQDSGALYEAWAQEYGLVYAVPSTLGSKRIVLCDPKAIAHFYSKDTWTYIQTPFNKRLIAKLFGKGLSWSHGEDHKRQRKSLTPAFSISAIRQLTSIFYDAAYKTKGAWDVLIGASGEDSAVIEVQTWMNHISLDTIGLAAFSHNFGALDGKHALVAEIFDSLSASTRSMAFDNSVLLLGLVFPFIARVPAPRMRRFGKLTVAMGEIADVLLARTLKEVEMGVAGGREERSIIGLLIKGSSGDSEFHLTKDEVVAQMKSMILAGYETTSISLSVNLTHGFFEHRLTKRLQWALLELSRNLDVQTKLRKELLELSADPTYDQLATALPYLDAVVHEILRVHPPLTEITRIAIEDDVIPLSQPVRTQSGELVDSVTIAKGTLVAVAMESINRSASIWGEDAKMFRPGRWLEDAHGRNGVPDKAREFQGHRHLLTFADGPKMCLGRIYALTEFKAVLSVLVKNYVFELRVGVDSRIEVGRGVLPRPKFVGEEGCKLPLRVRPYVG